MPAERKKKTKTPEDVPDMGDPDRKRVLNVLAQRRYRQRRREKIAALEAQAQGNTSPQPSHGHNAGGVQLPLGSMSSTSASPPTDSTDIEEIMRNTEDVGFPTMDFGNQDPLNMQLFEDFNFENFPLPSPVSPQSPLLQGSSTGSSSSDSPPSINFPLTSDGAQLEVPILSAIHAFINIAAVLDITKYVWDPLYLHTVSPTPNPNLPPNLHPTPAQMTIPHHPILDALPWPSVREKVICILSLPSVCRPPIARDEDDGIGHGGVVMRLVQDLDHYKEGVRVHGNSVSWGVHSELDDEAWEVGEIFFRNWWWCMDNKVIENSNRRRRERGMKALSLKE